MNTELTEIEIDGITVKSQLRTDFGDMATLENSVRNLGVLCPLIVDRDNVLISGARRLEACRNAGITSVPVVRLPVAHDSMTALAIRTDENLCRQPLSSEDLERHIQAKKTSIGAGASSQGGGFFAGLKRLFGS